MNPIKTTVAKVKNNVAGTLIGAGLAYLAAKKMGKVENKWALGLIALGGGILGAYGQSYVSAKMSKPTAATVKK